MLYLVSFLTFIVMVIVITAAGKRILSLYRVCFYSMSEELVFSFAIGFAITSYVIYAVGSLGFFYRYLLAPLFLAVVILLRKDILLLVFSVVSSGARFIESNKSRYFFILSLFVCIATFIMLIGALAPSYSNDSMVYHLTDAKYFAQNHRIGFIPYNSTNSLWPYMVNIYFAVAILFGLLPMAGLFHFSLALASGLGVYALMRRFYSSKAGFLACAIFLLTPGIFMEATYTYIDLGLVFYSFMAVYAFLIWRKDFSIVWAILCGVLCGFALSIKYLAVITPLILGVYMILSGLFASNDFRKKVLKSFIIFALFTVLASFTWYIRSWITLGNPAFPFFSNIFGAGSIDKEVVAALSEKSIRETTGVAVTFKNFVRLPWTLTIFPERFGGQQIGPLFLIVLPVFIFIKNIPVYVKQILCFALIYTIIWFVTCQGLRYFLVLVPILSVVSAYILCELIKIRRSFRVLVAIITGGLFVFLLVLCAYHNADAARVIFGLKTKSDYLSQHERSFLVSDYINKNLPEGSKLMVVNEGHTFFIDIDHKRELYYWVYTRYDKKIKSPKDVISFLKSEGFTHILCADSEYIREQKDSSMRLTEFMKNNKFKANSLRMIYKRKSMSENGDGIEYSIYQIKQTE